MHRIRPTVAVLFVLAGWAFPAPFSQAKGKEVRLGDRIGNVTFKDIHYLPRSLNDFPNKKAFVVAFTNTTCPLVQRYLPTLKQMEKEYRDKGVQFLTINVGADDSIVAMAAHAVKFDMEFPFVKDFDGQCVRALGVERTPGVAILDGDRRLRYRGRIDDQYRLGGQRPSATRNDLREALEEVLAGREVSVKETPVDGCPITFPEIKPATTAVTFAEHVAPIVRNHCQTCHRPDTSTPFSLITYQQVSAKADAIAEVVTDGRMPPWFACEDYGQFINKRSLTSSEKETLINWARSGKQLGDESKVPPPLKVESSGKWLIGKPDLILPAPKHDLPAAGDIPYKYVVLPYVFPEDTWIQRIQILPDNPRTVHHCNMAYITPGDNYKKSNFITGTVPGGSPMLLDQGMGFLIPKKASLVLQIHYVTTGKDEKCQISVGFKYAGGIIQKRLRHKLLEDNKFEIPPGAPAYPVTSTKEFEEDADALALFVHMHLRGRDMTFRARYPDGTNETLLMVPNYSFDWQIPYRWEDGKKRFPKGTKLEAVAHYDNSSFNPYNPDPKTTVKEGPQTYHEMMNGFVFYSDAKEHLNLDVDPKTGTVRSPSK
jgi:thiol-disulfide isomerase/thioredoxin